MQISTRQIKSDELISFINSTISGATFSGNLQAYISVSGFLGDHVVYRTGDQVIFQTKTFLVNPELIYTGTTGSAISRGATLGLITGSILSYSGFGTGQYVDRFNTQSIGGSKTFNSPVTVANPTNSGHAINLNYLSGVSGVLNTAISNVSVSNVLYTSGTQRITGQKIFDTSPLVVSPTSPSGAVPKSYVDALNLTGVLYITGGSQDISGVKNFLQSPTIPIGLNSTEPVRKSQLDAAIALVSVGTGSIQGVTSINGISGTVFIEGRNGISVSDCSGVIYVSGGANNTRIFSASIPVSSGTTGIAVSYGSGFNSKPIIVGTLEYTGGASIGFVSDTIYNSTTGGFNVAFSTGIPSTGYVYNINSFPLVSGNSGFYGLVGDRGRPGFSFNYRGLWQAGLFYNNYDVIFTSPTNVTYYSLTGHISDSFNFPSGTGNFYWGILGSGAQGPTGAFAFQGEFNTGMVIRKNYAVLYDDSTFGFSGENPVSGILPTALTGGWHYIAKKAPIGIFVNSGTITGNFTAVNFFLEPVGTGLNLAESFTPRNFTLTGFAIGCVDSGRGPALGSVGIMSGNLYTRDLSNTKTIFQNFTFDSGLFTYISGGLAQPITGLHRMGIDITNTLSGISKLSIGLFGFGAEV